MIGARARKESEGPSRVTSLIYAQLLLSLAFLPPTLRYFERLWGAFETAKFIVIVTVASNIIAFFVNWLEFIVTGYSEMFL